MKGREKEEEKKGKEERIGELGAKEVDKKEENKRIRMRRGGEGRTEGTRRGAEN